MKNLKLLFFSILSVILISNNACATEIGNALEKEPQEISNITNESTKSKLTFRAKRSDLWFKHKNIAQDTNASKSIEVTLPGEILENPKEIKDITKKEVDRNTIDGAVASYFSASKNGDSSWIVENFLDEEKKELEVFFNKGAVLEKNKKLIESIEKKEMVGKAIYKDYTLAFVKQKFNTGKIVTEAIAFKQTPQGWKATNSITQDETYDIVYAALAFGYVINEKGIALDNKPSPLGALIKPKIRVIK